MPFMNESRKLGEERSLFLICSRAAMLYLSSALALSFFVMGPPAYAQQVTPVPPFIGTHSETWESFGYGQMIPSGTSILGGIATISGDHMVTAGSFEMCTVTGVPSDGSILMDSDRPSGPLTISFSQPVSAFGAYWGSGVGCYGNPPSILTFRDVGGNIIGTASFTYIGDGTLAWHGYQFGTPVRTITRTAGDGQEGIAIDGLQATVGTHPAFFNGETALGGGWYYLQFANGTPFGYYNYLPDQHFIYHLDLGFEYLFDGQGGGIYFYDFASNSFFYTSPSTFPYLYDFSLNAWLYYLPDFNNPGRYSHNPRWFYNFATGQWITL